MPQTVEISDTNWIFVSKGSLEHHFDVIEKKEFDFLKKLKSLFDYKFAFAVSLQLKQLYHVHIQVFY